MAADQSKFEVRPSEGILPTIRTRPGLTRAGKSFDHVVKATEPKIGERTVPTSDVGAKLRGHGMNLGSLPGRRAAGEHTIKLPHLQCDRYRFTEAFAKETGLAVEVNGHSVKITGTQDALDEFFKKSAPGSAVLRCRMEQALAEAMVYAGSQDPQWRLRLNVAETWIRMTAKHDFRLQMRSRIVKKAIERRQRDAEQITRNVFGPFRVKGY